MDCPKCGHKGLSGDECPKCGIFASKYLTAQARNKNDVVDEVEDAIQAIPAAPENINSDNNNSTKKCSFCQEEIIASAIKCKHCRSILTQLENQNINPEDKKEEPKTGSNFHRRFSLHNLTVTESVILSIVVVFSLIMLFGAIKSFKKMNDVQIENNVRDKAYNDKINEELEVARKLSQESQGEHDNK